jgi:hypothetical protein
MPTGYSGPLYGLETTHVWNGSLVLNSESIPGIRLDKIVGLQSISEADDNRAPRTEQPGEVIYPSFSRGKTITYTGFVVAYNLGSLRSLQSSIIGAFNERSNEGTMTVGGAYYFHARPMALDMDDEQTLSPWASPSPHQRSFVLSLRLSDPAYYAA